MIIDQFIASAASKWGQTSRLTLFLPHGYEGNGPEHSSARLERFLQLAADDNMRIANPTTPAQHFHLLRGQAWPAAPPARGDDAEGPAALKDAASTLDDLLTALPARDRRPGAADWNEDISRLVLCSGKIYYDLSATRARGATSRDRPHRAAVPVPAAELAELLAGYPELETVVWAQEEPKNMGAWRAMRHRLERPCRAA